jgi:guanylate kinase
MAGRGKLIVVSAPSGAGKTTIAREILRRNPSVHFSVSATTRLRRPAEIHGRDYFFLSKEEFMHRVHAGEFVEWEEIYGEYYGTLKAEVDTALREGSHVLFDIDVKGALSIKRHYPEALILFIRPPSLDALYGRLQNRSTEDEASLARRLERVPMEMKEGEQFDAQIVNDELARAVEEVQSVVQSYLAKP